MDDKKNKKKTLTISTNTSKRIDLSSLSSDGKKTFSIEKKTSFIVENQNCFSPPDQQNKVGHK